MMERGAIGELIPRSGEDGEYFWISGKLDLTTDVFQYGEEGVKSERIAAFFGPTEIRMERVALFLTTEQS